VVNSGISRLLKNKKTVTLSEVETCNLTRMTGFDSAHPGAVSYFCAFFSTLLGGSFRRSLGFLFSSAVLGYAFAGCGDPPASTPAPYTGSIRVLAMDTATIRAIFIDLDDVKLGQHPNPSTLSGIVVGLHKVLVYSELSGGSGTMIEVKRDRVSDVMVWLLAEGPYVGQTAPKFSVRSIDDQLLDLQQLKGKVVLLAFFEHT